MLRCVLFLVSTQSVRSVSLWFNGLCFQLVERLFVANVCLMFAASWFQGSLCLVCCNLLQKGSESKLLVLVIRMELDLGLGHLGPSQGPVGCLVFKRARKRSFLAKTPKGSEASFR